MHAILVLAALACSAPPAPPAHSAENKRPTVVIPDFKANGVPNELTTALAGLVADELQRGGAVDVMTAESLRSLLQHEQQKQLLGCNEASCLSEIADALGADYVLSGTVSVLAGATPVYTLELALLDAKHAKRVSSAVEQGASQSDLSVGIVGAMREVMAPLTSALTGGVRVSCSEEGATVKVDGHIVGTTPLPGTLTIGAGTHLLSVEKDGFVSFTKELSVTTGATSSESVELEPSQQFIAAYESREHAQRLWTFVAAGGTAVAAGVAGFFEYQALSSYGSTGAPGTFLFERAKLLDGVERDTSGNHRAAATALQSSINLEQSVGLTAVAVAAAGLVATTVLLLTGDDPDRYQRFHRIEVPQ